MSVSEYCFNGVRTGPRSKVRVTVAASRMWKNSSSSPLYGLMCVAVMYLLFPKTFNDPSTRM